MKRTYYEARVVLAADIAGEYDVLYDEDGEIDGEDESEVTERAKAAYDPEPGWTLVVARVDVTYKTVA